MAQKNKIELGDIQRTLLLPLWGRAVETQKKEPLLVDKIAVEIVKQIDCDFSVMSKDLRFISLYGWIRRSILIDETVKHFLEKHPKATIVNIGCGLDTTFERVDNGLIHWFDLDMPDTIELRKIFIPESERRKYIVSSFLDYDWLKQLFVEDNILFIAAGVLYYFEEFQIKDFFKKLADMFSESEIVFDTASPFGVKMANKLVIKKSGFNEQSFLKWGFRGSKEFKLWDNRIELINEVSLFKNAKKRLGFKQYIEIIVSEIFKIQSLIHLKFKKSDYET